MNVPIELWSSHGRDSGFSGGSDQRRWRMFVRLLRVTTAQVTTVINKINKIRKTRTQWVGDRTHALNARAFGYIFVECVTLSIMRKYARFSGHISKTLAPLSLLSCDRLSDTVFVYGASVMKLKSHQLQFDMSHKFVRLITVKTLRSCEPIYILLTLDIPSN